MPNVVGIDAFDHGFDVPADYDAVFGTPTAVTTPLYQSRLNSMEVNSPGNEGVRKNYSGSVTRAWVGFPIRFDSFPAADVVVLGFSAAAGASVGRLAITGTGMYATGSGGFAAPLAVSTGVFHWVEAIFDVTGVNHSLYWRVDGVDGPTLTYTHGSPSTVGFNQLVSLVSDGTLTWYAGGYWAWGTASSITDWLGPPASGSVTADFVIPHEIQGVLVSSALKDIVTTQAVQRVFTPGRSPLVTDDQTRGYLVGDVWINGGQAWWCVANATGAATWKQVTA